MSSSQSQSGEGCGGEDLGKCFGVDFGGTLTKIVFFEPSDGTNLNGLKQLVSFLTNSETYGETGIRDVELSFVSENLGGRLHFIIFSTARTQGAIELIMGLPEHHGIRNIHATGGGAYKFANLFKEKMGIIFQKQDELETVVTGLVFAILEHPKEECFSFELPGETAFEFKNEMDIERMVEVNRPIALNSLFPFLVVNIGSGVSVIKVESPNSFKRVSGTAVGGGTYFGLCKLLTRCTSFDEAMDMAEHGDSRHVNLLVSDIYGGAYDRIGLPAELTASFFGKAAAFPGHVATRATSSVSREESANNNGSNSNVGSEAPKTEEVVFSDADISRALVVMVAQNVTQIAYLNALVHSTNRIVFTGNFLRHNKIAMRTLTHNIRSWSKGKIEPLFMKHEGHFGALGSCLYAMGKDASCLNAEVVEVEDPKKENSKVRMRSSSFSSESVNE